MTTTPDPFDVAVIGGGAAGLSAAVALLRSRRTVAVIDDGRPRNAPAEGVHNFLTRDGTDPGELLAMGRDEVAGYGGQLIRARATTASGQIGDFTIGLDDDQTVRTTRVIVATGLTDVLPDVPGLADHWGAAVLHCPYCHGHEVRDREILVLSTSAEAVHQALLFSQLSPHVTVLTHTGPDLSEDDHRALRARGVRIEEGVADSVRNDGDGVSGVLLTDGRVLSARAIVVRPKMVAHSPVLDALGLTAVTTDAGDRSYPTGMAGETDVPGVWVAGNTTDLMAQVISAAAAGLMTGSRLNAEMIQHDVATTLANTTTEATA